MSKVRWEQSMILAAASAGWVFDVYEGQLFTIFKTSMFASLNIAGESAWHGSVGMAAFLAGGAAGGLLFGVLGDRLGRLRALAISIFVYSLFSGLTALVTAAWQVHLLRFLVAVGTGGEWAVAAALVAESFPTRLRASASGIFHASSVLGTMLASLAGYLLSTPDGWRMGFLLGVLPALLVLLIRMGLTEPQQVRRALQAAGETAGNLSEFLRPGELRTRAAIGLGLATVGLASFWGIFAWSPELAGQVLGSEASVSDRQAAGSLAYLVMNSSGGLLGLLAFAPIASWRGRRFAFAFYLIGAGVTAPATFLLAWNTASCLALLSLMAFFVLGMHAGYAIYFPELFPTRLRASGSSVCFNLGRVLSSGVLLLKGSLGAHLGLRGAAVAMSCLFWIGLLLLRFAPETGGCDLAD
jgi:MFS family permease